MRVLLTRTAPRWRQVPVTVLLLVAQTALGLLVLALRTSRAVLTLAVATTGAVEQQLAVRTGRRPLSQTGIAALAAAFTDEFLAAYHQTR
ncbi:hypothetical protein [Streptomyces sp. NPDC020983]|uniref:hypothetical protein n=1 Tax=Streptomyces sp. NPDC020983 TaxID=3365106 RepID=UPI0037B064B2